MLWITPFFKNERKQQKDGFLGMLVGTLGALLFGNLLSGKDVLRAGKERTIRAVQEFLIPIIFWLILKYMGDIFLKFGTLCGEKTKTCH